MRAGTERALPIQCPAPRGYSGAADGHIDARGRGAFLEAVARFLQPRTHARSHSRTRTGPLSHAEVEDRPCVRVCRENGSWTGLAFHGVPGGHEFTSFVLGLYNAAGPGQALNEKILSEIRSLKPAHMKILVSLSCTMCPELVTAAQRIAAENPGVTAEVYDLNHFADLRERYKVMSVPCLVIDDGENVSFGKKNISQLLELLDK